MSQQYQVLARKYRPKNFHELVGQSHVSQALINAIDHQRLHHAYLFTGTRGVGKTTIARILSKCLNCETGITSTPCGVCDNCQAIDAGRFIDLIEIDAASRTKVEDTRELLDNVPYAPTQGRYKVYLIDEVHMLSTHSFNALLKTLEEPPEHVKFLLATTDPQKLPITIISRCLQFVLRPLPQAALSQHLANILDHESVSYTQAALWQLANAAKGSVRDALSLTDQAIAFGQGQLTDATVNDMLGLIDSADLVQLLTDIHQGDKKAVSAHIEQMRMQMVDAGSMFDGLAEILHQLAIIQLLPDMSMNISEQQADAIRTLATQISADVLQLYYEIVVQSRENMKLANTPMQALEMCLLRLLAFRPLPANEVIAPPSSMPPLSTSSSTPSSTLSDDKPFHDNAANQGSNAAPLTQNEYASTNDTDNHQHTSNQLDNRPAQIDELQNNTHLDSAPLDNAPQNSTPLNTAPQNDPSDITDYSYEDDSTYSNDDSYISDEAHASDEAYISDENDVRDENDVHLPPDSDTQAALDTQPAQYNVHEAPESESQTTLDVDDGTMSEPSANTSHLPQTNDSNQIPETTNDTQDSSLDASNPNDKLNKQDTLNQEALNQKALNKGASVQSANSQGSSLQDVSLQDPRELLRCPPQELTGEWTAEKWDYWLQTAREEKLLDHDELALARSSIMQGQCDGEAMLLTSYSSQYMNRIFAALEKKLQTQFPNTQITLQVDTAIETDVHNSAMLPQQRREQRRLTAEDTAQQMLLKTPVMDYLVSKGEAKIGKVKLSFSE